jgi:hypothetical protein
MISWVFAFLSFPLTLLLFLASMVVAVVLAAALEVRTPPRRRTQDSRSATDPAALNLAAAVRTAPVRDVGPARAEQPSQTRADEHVVVAADEPTEAQDVAMTGEKRLTEPLFSRQDLAPVEPMRDSSTRTPGSSRTRMTLGAMGSVQDSWVELGPLGIDTDIAGVLFAAYVTSGGSEWSRVTGWVRASDDPPSLEGTSTRERLRGKPARIRALLECRDDARNWVTIDDRTDIALAIDRRAPRDAVLVGLVHWWRLSMSAAPALAPHEVSAMKFGISAVKRELRGHPLAPKVQDVIDACRVAETAGVGLEQHLVPSGRIRSADTGDVAGNSGEGAPLEDSIAG